MYFNPIALRKAKFYTILPFLSGIGLKKENLFLSFPGWGYKNFTVTFKGQ